MRAPSTRQRSRPGFDRGSLFRLKNPWGWPQDQHAVAVALGCACLSTIAFGLSVWFDRASPGGDDRLGVGLSPWAMVVPGGVMTLLCLVGVLWLVERKATISAASQGSDATSMIVKDSLTGLLARPQFMAFADDALSYFLRYHRSFAMLMVQIDEPELGFQTPGLLDRALSHVADVLDLSLRKTDKICRFGRDRFAILLREISEQDAITLSNRMRERVQDFALSCGEHATPVDVTISIGVALVCRDDDSASTLLARAEAALEGARQTGPNTVGRSAAGESMPEATIVRDLKVSA